MDPTAVLDIAAGRSIYGRALVDVALQTGIVLAVPAAALMEAWAGSPAAGRPFLVRLRARFLGRRLAYTYEIVDLVPGERLVMRTAQGPFPMETTYGWQPVDHARTRMTLRNRGEPAGFGKIAAPVLAAAMRRANVKDLAALKQLLERPEPGQS